MNELYRDIDQRIAEQRRRHNMTQDVLSEKLDITVKHISAVERGKSTLSIDKLITATEIFDCSMDYLIKGENSPDYSEVIPKFILETLASKETEEKELLLEYLKLYQKIRKT